MQTPEDLTLNAYDYFLPEELIAQVPADQRENSRLLVYDRDQDQLIHSQFKQLSDWLVPGDLLVLNNTQVFPARIFGNKSHTGTRFEFLLVRKLKDNQWLAIAKNSKRIRVGYDFIFGERKAEILETRDGGLVVLNFEAQSEAEFMNWLESYGEIPYPPYISSRASEQSRYQTVFAEQKGSVAAPTAGLHFSEALIESLKQKGIDFVFLTLHVGIGTFTPVRAEHIEEHQMHAEYYEVSAETAARLNQQRQQGKRIIAVGTTATRSLETVYRLGDGQFCASQGDTRLFLYPGQALNAIDGLITNFHLPRSSLLMLVSAWIGRPKLLELYQTAVTERYRFYSFGDAMFIH